MKDILRAIIPVRLWKVLQIIKLECRLLISRTKLFPSIPLKNKHIQIEMGFHVVEHCNLNCASCDNFSPIAEPEFINVEEFRRDIERMAYLFKNKCERISLLGGEPLLHPELTKIIAIARKNFPDCRRLRLLTNGILLAQQPISFWEVCRNYNVTIVITHYPVNIDVPKIMELAEKYNIVLEYSKLTKKFFDKKPVNLAGDGNYQVNFALCSRGNQCIMLGHGHLFTCTFASNIQHFNKKFGANIPVTEADYIDIYKETDGEQILRKLTKAIPLCRFCDMKFQEVEWHISQKVASEWV